MPRRHRGFLDYGCYHITHRCHERKFLLKFSKDRDKYYELMLEANRRFKVSFLNYVITSNHIHFLVWSRRGEEISKAMQFIQGQFGQHYNNAHKREGSFWRDRYHSTLIESGTHLRRCLLYIDMNMLRAGAVDNIEDWKHTGYHELMENKKRYLMIDKKRLVKCLLMKDYSFFKAWYIPTLSEKLSVYNLKREPFWSQSVAVGSHDWLQGIYNKFKFKRKKVLAVDEVYRDSSFSMVNEEQNIYFIEG